MRPPQRFNFSADVLDPLARERPDDVALIAVDEAGAATRYSFAEAAAEVRRAAGALAGLGIEPGDVVATLIGSRAEWVWLMTACWRIGAVALPCNEMLRAGDLRPRMEASRTKLVVCAERDLDAAREAAAGAAVRPRVLELGELSRLCAAAAEAPAAPTAVADPALIIFTSGTSGAARGVLHAQCYLWGQSLQGRHWLGARAGDLVWCTAATGWSKSARNVFIAPWTCGAGALVHDARFDAGRRLELAARERVTVLCQAPTEYRMIAAAGAAGGGGLGALRRLVSAGEPLDAETVRVFGEGLGLEVHDGYGQTETGSTLGQLAGRELRPGSMGVEIPGFRVEVHTPAGQPVPDGEVGELCLWTGGAHSEPGDEGRPPTLLKGYLGGDRTLQDVHRGEWWVTGDRARRDPDGWFWFEGRADDVIISAGYRIGPFEVESALVSHPAVAEAAAVAAPDAARGSVVKAFVVLRDDAPAGGGALARELQDHVKGVTAPYKYPRLVEFVDALPKTASGKVKRAELRERG